MFYNILYVKSDTMARIANLTQLDPHKIKTLRVSGATLKRLSKFGSFGDTYERIINKLMDIVEEKLKNNE